MKSEKWTKLYEVSPSTKTIDNPVTIWVAHDPVIVDNPVENPDMFVIEETKWVDQDELQAMIDNHELHWSLATTSALQVFRKFS